MRTGIVLLFWVVFGITADALKEIVYVEDLNSDHERRNLDAGLPSYLEFRVKRQQDYKDVKLALQENVRLNAHHAPVFVLDVDENGARKVVKRETEPITDVRYYHDKRNGGSFSVRCQITAYGPCERTLTGNIYIEGTSIDIEPLPDIAAKRDYKRLFWVDSGTPHLMIENNATDKLRPPFGIGRGLENPDAFKIKDNKLNDTESLKISPRKTKGRKTEENKHATELYAVEVLVVLDPAVWKRHYAMAESTETLTREEATELALRQRFSHIMNGVSLRYESIEDPDMEIYTTLSGFLMLKTQDNRNPLPADRVTTIEGVEYAECVEYLEKFQIWTESLEGLPDNDHIMAITGYELYSDTTNDTGVAGIAYTQAACGPYKTSIIEEADFFVATSVATHELGHNLGSHHDGQLSSKRCDADDEYIMAPYVPFFAPGTPYSINPWRFSECSIRAFKSYITSLRSHNCLTDPGDYYNHEEYLQHTKKFPGELMDADTQCRFIHGDDSKLCETTDLDNICKVMKCLTPWRTCRYYTAARGTECGGANTNKMCIDGACVEKTSSISTSEAVTGDASPAKIDLCVRICGTTDCCKISKPIHSHQLMEDGLVTVAGLRTDERTPAKNVLYQCEKDVGIEGIPCEHFAFWFNGDRGQFCQAYRQECCATCRDVPSI